MRETESTTIEIKRKDGQTTESVSTQLLVSTQCEKVEELRLVPAGTSAVPAAP